MVMKFSLNEIETTTMKHRSTFLIQKITFHKQKLVGNWYAQVTHSISEWKENFDGLRRNNLQVCCELGMNTIISDWVLSKSVFCFISFSTKISPGLRQQLIRRSVKIRIEFIRVLIGLGICKCLLCVSKLTKEVFVEIVTKPLWEIFFINTIQYKSITKIE